MLINVKQVKQIIKDHKKQASQEFLERLNYIVRERLYKAIANAQHFKRLRDSDII